MAASSLAEQFDEAYAGGGKAVLAFWNATLPAAVAEPGEQLFSCLDLTSEALDRPPARQIALPQKSMHIGSWAAEI